ncbi:MAG TPA: cellulose binding domain-containing protein, partial [Polyangiaceae bacterium]|nr:cellulose binding domain-containing protein [Polyangiaceae bacterium]
MLSRRGAQGLGWALLVGLFAGCSSSGEVGRVVQADTAGANLKATIQKTTLWASGYCANVNITNSGTSAASTWVVVLEVNQASIY